LNELNFDVTSTGNFTYRLRVKMSVRSFAFYRPSAKL